MALVPDIAIDRLTELTKGARHYYVFLCRCRNQKTGLCCPSVMTTQEAIGATRATIYALRKELVSKQWAAFQGDKATQLLGFGSPIIQTVDGDTVEDTSNSPIIQTEDSASPENQTAIVEPIQVSESPDFQTIPPAETESPKTWTESPESWTKKSENLDSHIRNNQQKEPAKRTSKGSRVKSSGENQGPWADPFYKPFCQSFQIAYGCPYRRRNGDFVKLAALLETCKSTNWEMTDERWAKGLRNYFLSQQSSHTLADLSERFSTFYRSALDRFNKPIDSGNSSPGSSGSNQLTTKNTSGNREVLDGWVEKMKQRFGGTDDTGQSGAILKLA